MQTGLILQHRDTGVVQKFRKPPVPDDRFLLWKCESGEDLLAYVMVAPAGVCPVPALDLTG